MARPRSFDTGEALAAATQVFLVRGFDGATLDDLTAAMGVNKPSLYAAFGDKSALYTRVLDDYAAMAKSAMAAALDSGDTLEQAARALLVGAIEVYAPAKGHHLGCLVATTAITVAGSTPAIRKAVAAFLVEVDQLIGTTLERRFRQRLTARGLEAAGAVLSATVYSLAIRARAGAPRTQLLAIAQSAIDAVGAIAERRSGQDRTAERSKETPPGLEVG